MDNTDPVLEARRRFLAVAAVALGGSGLAVPVVASARQPGYPTRPVTIVIGFPPGTATDVLARTLADRLSFLLGQSFVVDNRAGMGGSIGATVAAHAKADGYTLYLGATAPISINPHVYPKLQYDPLTDFAPVAPLIWLPMMLVAPPALPASGLQQLLQMARESPGAVTFASTGNGTTSHLIMEMLASRANVKMSHVPYKGSAQAQTDIIGGRVSCSFDTLASSLTLVRAGKLKALAVSTSRRARATPDVPTVAEQGFPGFETVAWIGMLAPAGTPPAILDRLGVALDRIRDEPDFVARMTQGGNEIRTPLSRAEFASFIRRDNKTWGTVVRQFNVTLG